MTQTPDRIRADVQAALEANGIAPRRALRAAVRLVRGLALAERVLDKDPCETLFNMRDRISELLVEHGLAEPIADLLSVRIIDWLRKNWGGRTLTRQWWGFVHGGLQATSIEIDGELFPVYSDPVKSVRGRELRAVVWSILVCFRPSIIPARPVVAPRICGVATAITAMVETDWATIYVPKGDDLDRQSRDIAIHQKFAGLGSIDQVIAMGVGQSRAYEIYKQIRDARERREQPGLFENRREVEK